MRTMPRLRHALFLSLLGALLLSLSHCNQPTQTEVSTDQEVSATPWHHRAIWYQVFPERFANGDPANDPMPASLDGTWPYAQPAGWQPHPWTSDWYKLQPWEKATGESFWYNAQLRRYGGDLQGIIDKLDYLQDLGVNALYLNPVFESPSLHKYGAVYYHHIDKHFGPDPDRSLAMMEQEDPADPATWQWTPADSLFLELIQEVHQRDMHIVIDGVFNHAGIPFWAFQDVLEKGEQSEYTDWFYINSFDDPGTEANEFDYEGWYGVKDLPELREDEQGLIAPVRDHIKAVVQRWMDPNGDGDPSDGIDGWRLDVAHQVDLAFWKDFRSWCDEINPNHYLTGEVWWEDYEEYEMIDASPWLQGDAFHSVMNYRFGDIARRLLVDKSTAISPAEAAAAFDFYRERYGKTAIQQLMNVVGSHDTERLGSAIVNPDYRLDHDASVRDNPDYSHRKPTAGQYRLQQLVVALQFMLDGSPYVYYGDETGMWGGDDPDCRKPMVWPEMRYEPETTNPDGSSHDPDSVAFDERMFGFYQFLTGMRKEYAVLDTGALEWTVLDDTNRILGLRRYDGKQELRALFNASTEAMAVDLTKAGYFADDKGVYGRRPENGQMPPKSFFIWEPSKR